MNKDRVKGTIDEAAGTVKQKTGQLTGNTPLQFKGISQQVKGKLENAWGNAKDAAEKADKRNSTDSTQTNSARTEDRTQRKAG